MSARLASPTARVVVVGASLAGWSAARALRAEGFAGSLTIVGAEDAMPYERPPLSKAVLAAGQPPAPPALASTETFEELEATWLLGRRAVSADLATRQVELDGGDRLPYDGLVIATGCIPRTLDLEPLAGVHHLRSLADALALAAAIEEARAVAVIGAGFIGAEVAAAARMRGKEVSLIEVAQWPLARVLPAAVGESLARIHRDRGVDVRCGAPVARLIGNGHVDGIELVTGERVAADLVVVGVGARPATDWLEGSGLTLADGVVCDSRCAAAPGVVAAGDVARWWHPRHGLLRVEHWDNAAAQGETAARTLLHGEEAREYAPLPSFWSDQYEHTLHVAGVPGPADELDVVEGDLLTTSFAARLIRDDAASGVLALDSPRVYRRLRRELGDAA